MLLLSSLSLILAMVPPSGAPASPAPSPAPSAGATATPRALETIVTVVSSPYCNSLAEHFNGALVPLLGNDRTLDAVSVGLDDINTLFDRPDYVQRYLHVRDSLGRQEERLNESMGAIAQQIDQLRDGAHLTTDAQAASQLHDAAEQLQTAYEKQRQLAIDLQGLHQAMIDYNIMRAQPALGGFSPQEMSEPADMRNIKSYLRFQGQRDAIANAEDKAVDIAVDVAQRVCTKQK